MVKRFNRNGRQGVLHYVTMNTRNRCKVFKSEVNARATCIKMRHICNIYQAKLVAYVVMPEHIHFIVNPRDGDINSFISKLKPAITQCIHKIAEEQQNQLVLAWLFDVNKRCNSIWQDSKYNFHLYTDKLIWQKINYIHTNPIARKLVTSAHEYPFSSYRVMYKIDEDIIIPIDRDFWWDEIVWEG